MTAPELKPCPFCGGEASHNDGGNSVYGRYWWVVGCKNCDVTFADKEVWSKTDHGMLDPAYPPKHCFTAWNTRAEVDALVAGAQCLRDAQRAYMADRGNNDLGRLVGIRAEELDAVLAALTPTDARAALRDREEAAVRRALEEAQKDG